MNGKMLLIALVAAGSAFAGARIALGAVPASDPSAKRFELPALGERPSALSITTRTGTVEVGRPDVGFAAAAASERLGPESSLKTGADGRATLRLGVASTLQLEPSSELLVEAEPAGFVLKSGSATVSVRQPGLTVAVRGVDGPRVNGVADKAPASFSVRAGGRFALLVDEGSAPIKLQDGQEEFDVAPAHAIALGGDAAPAPIELPTSLSLDVQAPVQEEGVPGVSINGKTSPLARVRVGDVEAEVDAEGAFSAIVSSADVVKVVAWLPGREPIERNASDGSAAPADLQKPEPAPEPKPDEPEPIAEPEPEPIAEPEPEPEPEPIVKAKPKPKPKPKLAAKKKKKAKPKPKPVAKKKPKAKPAKGVSWGSSKSTGSGSVTWGGKK
ncbi:MAG: FecR family protein [Planctomycetota bacterium]|jgi:hypothetical protein